MVCWAYILELILLLSFVTFSPQSSVLYKRLVYQKSQRSENAVKQIASIITASSCAESGGWAISYPSVCVITWLTATSSSLMPCFFSRGDHLMVIRVAVRGSDQRRADRRCNKKNI